MLPRIVGPQVLKELMFLADDVSAERCRELNIANRVRPPPSSTRPSTAHRAPGPGADQGAPD